MAQMIYHGFLDRLAKARQFGWGVDDMGGIRALYWGVAHCPITAVALAVTRKQYHAGQYETAARKLGLASGVRDRIQEAADGANNQARRQILSVMGLLE